MPALRPRVLSSNKPGTDRKVVAAGNDDQILKAIAGMIPVEVIAAYNPLINIIPADKVSVRFWLTVAMIPITALWIAFATKDDKNIAWRQVIIAPFAFACWTSAMQ